MLIEPLSGSATINKMFQLVQFNILVFSYILMGFQRQLIYNCIFNIHFVIDTSFPKCLKTIISIRRFQ